MHVLSQTQIRRCSFVDKSKTFSFSRVVEYDTQGQTVNKSESIDE